jgi:hypothetical protein
MPWTAVVSRRCGGLAASPAELDAKVAVVQTTISDIEWGPDRAIGVVGRQQVQPR